MVWSDPKSLVMMLALMWKSRARAWMRWCAAEVGQISGVFVFVVAFLYLYMYLYFYIRVCICIYVSVFVFVCLYLYLALCVRWKIGLKLWCAAEVWQISGVPPKQTKQPADNERHDSFLTKNLLLCFHFFSRIVMNKYTAIALLTRKRKCLDLRGCSERSKGKGQEAIGLFTSSK